MDWHLYVMLVTSTSSDGSQDQSYLFQHAFPSMSSRSINIDPHHASQPERSSPFNLSAVSALTNAYSHFILRWRGGFGCRIEIEHCYGTETNRCPVIQIWTWIIRKRRVTESVSILSIWYENDVWPRKDRSSTGKWIHPSFPFFVDICSGLYIWSRSEERVF